MIPQSPRYRPPGLNRVVPRRVTRALVWKILYGDDIDHDLDDMPSVKPASSEEVMEVYASPAEDELPELEDMRKQLAALADQEQMAIDWSPEYSNEQIKGSTPQPAGMNTEVLERIALAKGPRPSKRDDILKPLRGGSTQPAEESYNELRSMLQEWNRKVLLKRYGPYEKPNERDNFLVALKEHISVLAKDQKSEIARKEFMQSLSFLRAALHAFRPEAQIFENQSVYTMLAALIANTMVADPDIRTDLELREMVLRTMLAEARYHIDGDIGMMKRRVRLEIEDARRNKDKKELARLKEAKYEINTEEFREGCRILLQDLRTARMALFKKTLEDMKDLCVLHAAEKGCSEDLLESTFTTMYEQCEKTEAETQRVFNAQMDTLDLVCDANQSNLDVLRNLADDCLRRARKFSARDIKDPVQRAQVLAERLMHPGTAEMMFKVREETDFLKDASKLVLQRMPDIEHALEKILQAAKGQLQAYDALHTSIEVEEEFRPSASDPLRGLYDGG